MEPPHAANHQLPLKLPRLVRRSAGSGSRRQPRNPSQAGHATALRPVCARVQEMQASEFTPMRIRIAKATRKLSCARARAELGYEPEVSLDEGLKRTVAAFSHLRADKAA